ncbi:MAG TPA: T9SS type A sorting domain-containing protein [Bacteroidia bacterium]|nr:T9SS type A sorting domain-containing protein [Bacteroidia bacterium]HRS57814.1 T9SS type A sorting domain-containing protein [Bacteroidia bacterium]HRU67886.1 T9SS type A sorting domain-containing protein [Bacteroidia bacterium]
MKKIIIIIACLITQLPVITYSQFINNGGHISLTNGSALVINNMNFTNQSSTYSGDITNSGKIFISGNWTNSASDGQLFDSTASAGEVIFTGSSAYTISGAPTHFYKLSIDQNASVDVAAANLIKVYNDLTNNGTFTLKSNTSRTAMLIDAGSPDNLKGSGTYRFERYIPQGGWHYVSTPCVYTSNSVNVFWGAALYDYNETTKSWNKKTNNQQLDVMRGYDAYFKNGAKTVVFEGKYNTGQISISLTKNGDGYNFVGNPYPTTVNWDESSGWVKTNVDNAIYIWDPTLNSGQGDYMEYVNGVGNRGGTRFIPATQAFWVKCNSAYGGSLTIKNQAKCSNSSVYFRSADQQNEILRIKAIQPPYDNEATISLNPDATSNFDGQYDALKIFHNNISIPQIYTVSSDNKELAINSLNIPEKADGIPLGLKPGQDGKCTLSFNLSEISPMTDVYLEDKFSGRFIDLRANPVNVFDVLMSDNPDRFVIHFARIQSVSGIDEKKPGEKNDVYSYYANGNIYIFSADEMLNTTYKIFDLSGREIKSGKINGKGVSPVLFNVSKGIYLVNLNNNGEAETYKIVVTQ